MSDESYVLADIDGLRDEITVMNNEGIRETVTLKINTPSKENCITFMCDSDTWFMRIRNNQFVFNEERFPDMAPSDFAREFVRLLKLTKLIQDYELPPL